MKNGACHTVPLLPQNKCGKHLCPPVNNNIGICLVFHWMPASNCVFPPDNSTLAVYHIIENTFTLEVILFLSHQLFQSLEWEIIFGIYLATCNTEAVFGPCAIGRGMSVSNCRSVCTSPGWWVAASRFWVKMTVSVTAASRDRPPARPLAPGPVYVGCGVRQVVDSSRGRLDRNTSVRPGLSVRSVCDCQTRQAF